MFGVIPVCPHVFPVCHRCGARVLRVCLVCHLSLCVMWVPGGLYHLLWMVSCSVLYVCAFSLTLCVVCVTSLPVTSVCVYISLSGVHRVCVVCDCSVCAVGVLHVWFMCVTSV